MKPIFSRLKSAANLSGNFDTTSPSTTTLPLVGRVKEAMSESSVLFPLPLGPINSTQAPFGILRVTSFRARTSLEVPALYILVTFTNSIIVSPLPDRLLPLSSLVQLWLLNTKVRSQEIYLPPNSYHTLA